MGLSLSLSLLGERDFMTGADETRVGATMAAMVSANLIVTLGGGRQSVKARS